MRLPSKGGIGIRFRKAKSKLIIIPALATNKTNNSVVEDWGVIKA